jgi:RNA polymerase sigma-70 factor, ECF subfamily
MNLTDYYIQKKIQGGDIGEYERLFVRFYEPLCRHAFNILKDMDIAEDIVQEFFYQFWKNRETFSPKLSLNAYFFQSIRNNCFHYLKHLTVRQQYATEVNLESNKLEPSVVQPEIDMAELDNAINMTLHKMPERVSLIFRMNRFEGRKYKEIAEILSISVKTVEADMGKALQVFRESLKEFTHLA